MVFHTPWGFLALLSLPAILLLHFFRSRRRTVKVGGLHLWMFAPTRLPAGAKWQRLVRSAPLFLELLAALLLSLLLAGMDIPRETREQHYTIVLDDSASMSAVIEDETFADRARERLREWAPPDGRYTVVACGLEARLIAGPFAEWDETREVLSQWSPAAPGCNLTAGVNLASKFQIEGGRMLFVTDEVPPGNAEEVEEEEQSYLVMAVGEPSENVAIEYADRSRLPMNRDRVYVTVKAYTTLEREVALRATSGETVLNEQTVTFQAGEQKSFTFDTAAVNSVIELSLGEDTVPFDNTATLVPLRPKVVAVTLDVPDALVLPLSRAISAVPRSVIASTASDANLVFTTAADWPDGPAVARVVQIPPAGATVAGASTGNVILANRYEPLTQFLPLEGLIWAYTSTLEIPPESREFLSAGDDILMAYEPRGYRRGKYYLDLSPSASNVSEQPAWPLLVKGLIDETRRVMPGMSRTNYRVGEDVPLSLNQPPGAPVTLVVARNGEPVDQLDRVPPSLVGLEAGVYEIRDVEAESVAAKFAVNLFAPGESDIRASASNQPKLEELRPESQRRRERNMPLFYLTLLAIIGAIGASWILQDSSR